MPPVPDLTIHDIQKKDRVVMNAYGTVSSVVEISYYVGEHGPFYLSYPKADYSDEKARAAMMNEVQGLRILLGQ